MAHDTPHTTATFEALDGHPLTAHLHEPASPARATILALPGIGAKQRLFRHVARYFRERGVRVMSIDYRGLGDSPDGDGSRAASLSRWAEEDIGGALAYMERRGWPQPVVLAHSFGGQAIGLNDALHDAAAAIFVGSQLGHPHHWRGVARLKIALFWWMLHACTELWGRVPRFLIGERLPLGVAREWRRWAAAEDWLLSYKPEAAARYARFERPVLAYAVSDDDIAPSPAVDALLRRLSRATVERIDVTPAELSRERIGHMGLFRPQGTGAVWARWLDFVLEHGRADADFVEMRRAS